MRGASFIDPVRCVAGKVLPLFDLPRTTFAVAFFSVFHALELSDPDYYWHLKTGEYLIANGFPAGDPFSHTFHGQPWALHEWLFQFLLYGVFSVAGAIGVKAMTAAAGVFCAATAYATARRVLGVAPLALLLALAFLVLGAPGIAPRPQLVTYALFAVFVHLLVCFKYCGEDRGLWLMPPLMVLWVNCHGGYIIGLALLALFTASEWLRLRLATAVHPQARKRLARLGAIALTAMLASALNPDFVGRWLYPFHVLNMDFAIGVIQEWASPNFHRLHNQLFLLLVLGFLIASIHRRSRPDLTELALPLVFSFLGFLSARHVPLAVLALIPFTAVAVAAGTLPERYVQRIARGKQLGDMEYAFNCMILFALAALLLLSYPAREAAAARRIGAQLPVRATEYIRDNGISGRMFNEYAFGGYLIYALYPAQRVFIDGRADVYGDAFLKEYSSIIMGAPGWERAFDKYGIDYVLTRRTATLRQLLLMRGDFHLAYDDEYHSVLVRPSAFERVAGAAP